MTPREAITRNRCQTMSPKKSNRFGKTFQSTIDVSNDINAFNVFDDTNSNASLFENLFLDSAEKVIIKFVPKKYTTYRLKVLAAVLSAFMLRWISQVTLKQRYK